MFFKYVGSKRKLADMIISKIPDHKTYVEVFAGAGHIFFKKKESEVEVINDINKELITFYRVLQNHADEFIKQFEWIAISRLEWYKYYKTSPENLTDIQRAVRFYYCICNGFGGKVANQSYGYNVTSKPSFSAKKLKEMLDKTKERMLKVNIECLPYDDILKRYDREATLFYLDPPYHHTEDMYGKGIFSKDDYIKIASILSNIKGKFMLSINDTELIREVFKGFNVSELSTTYTLAGRGNKKDVKELLYQNF